MRTLLGKARGLSSAKSGTRHWWRQRLTALGLVPLVIWFVTSLVLMSGADFEVVTLWMKTPWVASFMLLFIAVGFYHLKLGIQVVIEDYIENENPKIAAIVISYSLIAVIGLLSAVAVFRISFGSWGL